MLIYNLKIKMNFICSEVENMNISTKYYEFIKHIYENVSKYIKK